MRTAAKTQAKASRATPTGKPQQDVNADKMSKSDYDKLRNRLKNAPDSVVKAWGEVESLALTNPKRAALFDAILGVRKGDFSQVLIIIEKEWTRTSGLE